MITDLVSFSGVFFSLASFSSWCWLFLLLWLSCPRWRIKLCNPYPLPPCLTTYNKISLTKLCAPFLVLVFLVTSFKCRFSVTINKSLISLINNEPATDVLLILSRMKHTLFWFVLMLSWSAYAINSSICLMPYQQIVLCSLFCSAALVLLALLVLWGSLSLLFPVFDWSFLYAHILRHTNSFFLVLLDAFPLRLFKTNVLFLYTLFSFTYMCFMFPLAYCRCSFMLFLNFRWDALLRHI